MRLPWISWRGPTAAFFLLPALLVLAGYGWTSTGFFVSDDFQILHDVRAAEGLLDVWTLEGGSWGRMYLRPLPLWTWWLQEQTIGFEPISCHLFSMAIHALNAGLVAWLASIFSGCPKVGTLAGAAFAVFPIHPEAVTWISGRYDLLSATGCLISLLAWLRYLGNGGSARHLLLCALGLCISLLSKEMGLAIPMMLPVLGAAWYRRSRRRLLAGLIVLLTLTGAYLLVRMELLGGMGGKPGVDGRAREFSLPLDQLLDFLPRAVGLSFLPGHYERFPSLLHPLHVLPTGALGVALFLTLRARRVLATVLVFAPSLALFALSLIPLAGWATVRADNQGARFLYLPTAFSCMSLAACFLCITEERLRARVAFLAGLLIATWFVALTCTNQHWDAAARTSRLAVSSFPEPSGDTRQVYVTGLPDHHHGAYVFRNGFNLAARVYVDPELSVKSVKPDRWSRVKERAPAKAEFYRWDQEAGRWR